MRPISAISQQIWDMKYRLKADGGTPVDRTLEDTWRRIADALAATEADADRTGWGERFFTALEDFKFLPAGRIVAGAGTGRQVTLFNCFVMGAIPDDMAGIFSHLKEAALTMQQGGGIGYDFSTLRPKGAPVKGVGADASGPLSFMDVWDAMCRTIMSAGYRRGAMMATLACDHPDIEAFIEAKREPGRLRMFNLSVLVSDAFMTAVKEDAPWELKFNGTSFKTVRARELWDRIMRATYAFAEPGVIFIDRINKKNNLHYCETIRATNPCVTGDTLVTTFDGPKRIDEMLEGEYTILGSDGRWHLIDAAFPTGIKPVLRLRFDNGTEIRTTRDHRFLTLNRGDVAAEDLTKFDRVALAAYEAQATGTDPLVGREWGCARLLSCEVGEVEQVYDLTEPNTHHFVANGLVVHNCGEQPLPPYGACLLGSINVAALIKDPFTPEARLDEAEFDRLVPLAVRMMDNTIDVSRFPLDDQKAEAQAKRRIGLGVTGLADALIMCRVRYGSEAAVRLTETWMRRLERQAYLASIEIAKEKGPFPLFEAAPFLAGETVAALDKDIKDGIAKYGIRNALLTSIAPTGTISLLADNVSSGLEPVFSFSYTRNVLMPDGTRRTEEVSDYAYRLYRRLFGETTELPDYFVDAQRLSPSDHVVMQAACQNYVDASISKTINCPEDITFEAFKNVYEQAYELGCKGCTTYRPNDVTGAVLAVKEEVAKQSAARPVQQALPLGRPPARPADEYEAGAVVYMTQPLDRPEALPGQTYKVKWPDSEHAIYITVNDVVMDGRRRPFEVFINSKNMEHYAWTVALTRMISAVFRRGGDVSFVVDELKAVFDPRGGQWMGGRYVPSLLAAIGEVIERHMINIGFLAVPGRPHADPALSQPLLAAASSEAPAQISAMPQTGSGAGASSAGGGRVSPFLRQCPKCGSPSLIRQEGCDTCTSCDYSKCA